jgi:hypothetical protein
VQQLNIEEFSPYGQFEISTTLKEGFSHASIHFFSTFILLICLLHFFFLEYAYPNDDTPYMCMNINGKIGMHG